ncbi:hypothetical protein F5Y15DRAFT_353103 [Xylariaceae sp. FL0016]|nr:hypothetical protein F5Y15DRAFT_353103 [Xylariaceae sp. FL0016]
MQILPFVQVQDLPPSASFYSAVTQPLGLRYLSADSSSIVFGDVSETPHKPVFEIKRSQTAGGKGDSDATSAKPSRMVLSAHSPSVVSAFRAAAVRANPDLQISVGEAGPDFLRANGSGNSCTKITDLEGNIMEVVYVPPPEYPAAHQGSTIRKTQSTNHEASRILDWNLDVASSVGTKSRAGTVAPSRPGTVRGDGGEPCTILRRSVTTSTLETGPRQTSGGLSTGTVIGSVLGAVAAGAAIGGAITYAMVRNDRERAPQQEFDAPSFQRRSTFPDPYPDHRPRYVEVERTVERIHYPEQYPPSSRKYPPPSYVARYSQVDGPTRSRTMEEVDDHATQARAMSHYTTGSRARRRSEAGSTRRPLMIADTEYRSEAGSKHTSSPKLLMDAEYRSHVGSKHTSASKSKVFSEAAYSHVAPSRHTSASKHSRAPTEASYRSHATSKHSSRPVEVETYVSARSDRSASTVRPAPSHAASKAGSRYSTATVKMPGVSRAPSHASARHVPLPASRSASKADWDALDVEDVDDVGSVAPSDSISCVGSKHSRRSHHWQGNKESW